MWLCRLLVEDVCLELNHRGWEGVGQDKGRSSSCLSLHSGLPFRPVLLITTPGAYLYISAECWPNQNYSEVTLKGLILWVPADRPAVEKER